MGTPLNRMSAYPRMAGSRSGAENRQNDPGTSVTTDNKDPMQDELGHNNRILKPN